METLRAPSAPSRSDPTPAFHARLGAALEAQVAAGCPGALLRIDGPGLDWVGARGAFRLGEPRALHPDDPFRVASVTKALTATIAGRLLERGVWDLDDPIGRHVPPVVLAPLLGLEGLTSLDALTLRRLLGHTSGLPDYFFDASFQERVRREPERNWRPVELVEAAGQVGKLDFEPGADFAYGDTGYVLVGLALEHVLGAPLHEVYRREVLDPLELEATYLEWHEPRRGRELSHHYEDGRDLRDLNTSYDWAGGGLVTTAADLARFFRALFDGTLLGERGLAELTAWRRRVRWRPGSSARYTSYGLGLGTSSAYGEQLVGVTGVWGAFAWYWPARDTVLAGTVNRVGADRAALLDTVVQAVEPEGEAAGVTGSPCASRVEAADP